MNDYNLGQLHTGTLLTISDAVRGQHIYIIGKSGTGKSSLLSNLMLSDFCRGLGYALLDPHGDLAVSMAAASPPDIETIYFDPLDTHPVRYNPVAERVPPIHRATVAANIVSTFKNIWADSWGPNLEYVLTNDVRLLLEQTNQTYSLTDIKRVLTDKDFRHSLLVHCKDEEVLSFWTNEFGKWNERLQTEKTTSTLNKVGQFASNPILRDILKGTSTIDIKNIMDNNRVLLCNLSKSMGDEPSKLIGSLLVTAFAQAAQARADQPEEDRVPFTLYVDEFQNFATETFASILSEARKYRLRLVLAHQYQDQLPEALKHAVMGNAGTTVCFRIGVFDSPTLAKELGTSERSLLELANYDAVVKTMNGRMPTEPLHIKTLPVPAYTNRFTAVQERTRNKYARRRE